MNARKFSGSSAREALRAVKQELGAEAVILSTREVDGRIEMTAVTAEELHERAPAAAADEVRQAGGPAWESGVVEEIKSLRGLLEAQLGGLVWGELQRREPAQAGVLRQLLQSGFSPGLARLVTSHVPAAVGGEGILRWVRSALAHNFACAAEDEIVTAGGVYALMGPTGVGKTTTTAKIAARCVVRYGAERLALLTTDSFRIGAHEQLRIYGRILGVAVQVVRDAEDLRAILGDLRDKHMVLIDTVGMGQRDQMVAEQVAMLDRAGRKVNRLLLLGACGSAGALDEVVRAYRGEDAPAGAILTKLDEAVGLGGALDVIIRHRLRLHYVSNGQRVPEDLHAPNRDYLLHRALSRETVQPAYRLDDLDMPALLGGRAGVRAAFETAAGA
jgi:flagellar biosynthesis protein FlhF